MKKTAAILLALTLVGGTALPAAANKPQKQHKRAIVLASFGTTWPQALKALLNIENRVQKAFPDYEVRLAFTSNIIRNIWHKRQHDKKFQQQHPDIPRQIMYVQGPLATIATLQDAGYRTIYVQPTHIYAGEEYRDLCSYVAGLNSIKTIKARFMPFSKLAIGRPALGKPGDDHPYHEDMQKAVATLKDDVATAAKHGAALVYMGHGNEFFSTGIYAEFQQMLRRAYPDTAIFVGTVEGFPSFDDVLTQLKHTGVKKVFLKPMMVVAGDHANNDMAGDDDDSWKKQLEKNGISVITELKGLGENDAWADIYVEHLKELVKK